MTVQAMAPKRVGVLISGRGSNLHSLLDAQTQGGAYRVSFVLSNRPEAAGLGRAEMAGVATAVIDHTAYGKDRVAFEEALDARLLDAGIDVVALAGFMRVLTPWFVRRWGARMINIHPSLLPLFPGLHTHARALDAGVKLHGCTVHWVSDGVDEGAIIGQAAVPVLQGDTPDSLAARVLAAEHQLYPACLELVCGGAPEAPSAQAQLANGWI
jgi:phosphoribosylglycinamide formyltransferase-1